MLLLILLKKSHKIFFVKTNLTDFNLDYDIMKKMILNCPGIFVYRCDYVFLLKMVPEAWMGPEPCMKYGGLL